MKTQSSNQSRMFRSIVLMGSGLALGCGGKAGVDADGAAGKVGNAGSAGSTGIAGSSAVGGASAGGASAGGASAGGASFAGGGVGGAGSSAGTAGALDCPPAQWVCTGYECDENGWSTSDCRCDSERPKSASDCDVGESFVCKRASDQLHAVECSCVASGGSCTQRCRAALSEYADGYSPCDESQAGTVLCGCSIVLLK